MQPQVKTPALELIAGNEAITYARRLIQQYADSAFDMASRYRCMLIMLDSAYQGRPGHDESRKLIITWGRRHAIMQAYLTSSQDARYASPEEDASRANSTLRLQRKDSQ